MHSTANTTQPIGVSGGMENWNCTAATCSDTFDVYLACVFAPVKARAIEGGHFRPHIP